LKAIILVAGQGKRLLPLTADDPKALLQIGERRSVAWQISALAACGVDDVVLVTGFNADKVDRVVDELAPQFPACRIRTIYNPFYAVCDNLVSVWSARAEMTEDFLLINGDTLFQAALARTVLDSPRAPVTVTIDRKAHYDEDDMKVRLDGDRLVDIGKKLPLDQVQAESIGMLLFRDQGPQIFAEKLDALMRDQASLRKWYLSVIADLAADHDIATCLIEGHAWCEVDYPLDLKRATQMVSSWHVEAEGALPSASLS
jgi:choline kinase